MIQVHIIVWIRIHVEDVLERGWIFARIVESNIVMELLLSDFHQVLVALVLLVVDVHLEPLHLIFELLLHRLDPLLVLMLLMFLPPQLIVLDSLRIERSGLG